MLVGGDEARFFREYWRKREPLHLRREFPQAWPEAVQALRRRVVRDQLRVADGALIEPVVVDRGRAIGRYCQLRFGIFDEC